MSDPSNNPSRTQQLTQEPCTDCKKLVPTWEQLAEDYQNEPNVLVAKVDAEGDNSKATAKAQGVTSYPTIKYFPAGSKEAEIYGGGRSEADFVSFLNEKAGTHRTVGGSLDMYAGTIESLNTIVDKFSSAATPLTDALKEAQKEAAGLKEQAQFKYAEYYVRVFDKLSKNDDYVSKELARLEGILKKGGLEPTKLDEFTSKTNILRRFLAEKVQQVKDEL